MKPTALDKALNDWAFNYVSVYDEDRKTPIIADCDKDTFAAARRELQVLRELCEAEINWHDLRGNTDEGSALTKARAARDAYRQWRAEQEQQK